MESQHNGIIKPFSQELYEDTRVTNETVKLLFPILKVIVVEKKSDGTPNMGIDSYWVQKDCEALRDFKPEDIHAKIEWEKALPTSWNTVKFPYPTASCLVKKEKYVDPKVKVFFLRLNHVVSNAYCHPLNVEMLKSSYIEKIARRNDSIAQEGEERYAIPKKLAIFGIDCIEPFIVYSYLNGRKIAQNEWNKYIELRKSCNRPVPQYFFRQLGCRKFLLKPKA